jgi:AMP-binding protein
MTQNLHGIVDEKIVEKKENSVSLEFSIPESSDFFDGHFPEFKLLPAVAQFEVVTRFSRKYFNTQRYVPAIKRIKFSNPIRPDTNVHLDLEYRAEKSSVSFSMQDADIEGKVYSSGSFSVIPE